MTELSGGLAEALETLTVAWWRWLAPLAVHGAVVMLGVALVESLLPERTWPQLRAALWYLALATLALPALPLPLPLELLPGVLGAPAFADPAGVSGWATPVVMLWLTGALFLATVVGLRGRRRRRSWEADVVGEPPPWVVARAEEVRRRLGLRRSPRLRWTAAPAAPLVAGLLRPGVYLPAGLDPQEADHVLLHELAHLRRRDLWSAALVTVLVVVYWFHPLVWWAAQRLAALREQCCDRTVATVLGEGAAGYRRTLAVYGARRLAPELRGSKGATSMGTLGFLSRGNLLMARLRQLRWASSERPWLRRMTTAGTAALMLWAALPAAPAATARAREVADLIERPPGCLQLRYLVLQRLAQESKNEEGDSK